MDLNTKLTKTNYPLKQLGRAHWGIIPAIDKALPTTSFIKTTGTK